MIAATETTRLTLTDHRYTIRFVSGFGRLMRFNLRKIKLQTKQREKQSLDQLEGATAFLVPNQLLVYLGLAL